MACDDPINQTKHFAFNLKQDTPYDPVTQITDLNKNPIDLAGYTFESRFLSKDPDVEPLGATILDEAVVTLVGILGNSVYKELLSEAENNALIALSTPPPWWEFFATKDGVRHKWFTADVGVERAGGAP